MKYRKKYILLIEKLLSKKITTEEFEKLYLKEFKSETDNLSNKEYEILNNLFHAVDAYCGDKDIANYNQEDPFRDISEEELLREADICLKKLLTPYGSL